MKSAINVMFSEHHFLIDGKVKYNLKFVAGDEKDLDECEYVTCE